ncbi:S-antigen protein [Holothuria leucospilota]|uniref:S-antigen protein n=1 Tax=Holothuria leucospilota TaxID=206669 RepID=A0A9Q1C3N3_HOLLE|nr:S-antigen protein [Holothuria leucospilota]
MENQNNRNVTRENEDRFLFKKPAVPLFPAAASSAMGPGANASDEKSNLMKQESMRPGQPFWKMMTQSDKSPLHSVNQGESGPSLGMGNNQNIGIGSDGGGPFRRNFRGAGELPPFIPPRDGPPMNPFLRDLPNSQPHMEGSNNRSIQQTFDYNHGVPGPGGPNGPPGPFMGPRDIPEGGRPPEPRPLMEVTIPNPAALFQKLHAKLDKKDDPSPGRDPRQQGQRQSPRQRNDSQRRQPGPSNRPGDQGKQKGSPDKGGKTQNEAWNRGLKRMAELKNQTIQREQVAKKKKTETNTNKKGTEPKSMEPPVLEYDAESLKLMDAIAQGSQQHQLQLVKAIGIKETFTGRAFIPWMCYICDTETWTWQVGAGCHQLDADCHQSDAGCHQLGASCCQLYAGCRQLDAGCRQLGAVAISWMLVAVSWMLVAVSWMLVAIRVSFSIGAMGKTDSEGGTTTGSNSSSTPTSPALAEAVSNKKGMFECKPCSRFFLQRERMQNHMKSEGHMKRENFLKQRYGNSWLDYHWYNQAKRTERRDAEPQGIAFVLPVSGYFCKLCSRFYNSEITAKDVHCRQIGHIDKVKEWDRQQLTKKEAIKLKLNVTEIETAVQKKEELASRISRWSRPKLSSNSAEVVVVDSDPEDESDKKNKDGKERGKIGANSNTRKEVPKTKDEDLEEGELSEAEVLRMEKQQQEDRIKEEWMKREAKKREKEQKEKEQRERERKEKEAKERKEREAREEKIRKAKEEKEKREREKLEREKMLKKLQEEKRQLEQKKKEFQQQVERERKEKEEKERLEKEAREKQEKARKLQEEQEKKLRETRMREMLELETRIRQQEKRERDLLEERVQLGKILALNAGTPDRAFIERDMRDKEIRGKVVREQLDKDIKKLEELKRLQLKQVAPDITAREEDTRAKVEAEMKKAEEKRLREERLKEVEKRERELQEIEKREQERQKIEEKERELLEIEMRDKARREQELQERREQELFAIRELERKARLEEEMEARRQHEMQARREQEMRVRQEQEMKARQEQEMKARQEQEMQARHEQEMQASRKQEMKARQEQEMQARLEQEMKVRQEQEMKTRQEQEMKARQEQEMQARREMEMQARREEEMQARQEQEMLRMREQEILARREQDIQAWQVREAQMVAEGVSEVDILQQRHVFQQQLEEKYAREGPLPVGDVTREATNLEMEREIFLSELRQKARGELMMKAMQLQREGLTDAEIQELMVREEEIMKQRIFEEMQRRGFADAGVPPGHVGAREIDPTSEQGMAFGGDERDQQDGRRDREWSLREQEMIERERRSRDREMRQRSPERDYDERDNMRYIEEAGGRSIEGGRDDTLRYDRDYPPSPDNYDEDDDYYSDEGSYEEGDVGDEYDNVQGDEDERLLGINRDGRGVVSRRDIVPRQGRPPLQRTGDRRRRRKRGGRGQRRRQGRGGAARRGR